MRFETETVDTKYIIQGERASTLEWVIALAADELKLPYNFQYDLWGGAGWLPGGVSIDFVFYTPIPIPCEALGLYWHTGMHGEDDALRKARIAAEFGRQVEEIWEQEVIRTGETMRRWIERAKDILRERIL